MVKISNAARDRKLRAEMLADNNGETECNCFVCGKWCKWVVGHFVNRWKLATRWDRDNVRMICSICNLPESSLKVFEENLREDIGNERVDRLLSSQIAWKTDL